MTNPISSPDPSNGTAAETLRHVDRVSRGTRRRINAAWFPLLLWGAIVLISAPITLAPDALVPIYWILAAPAGVWITIRFFRSRGFKRGIEPRHRRILPVIGVAIGVACFALGWAGGDMVSAVGPMYAVAVGVLAFATLSRIVAFAYVASTLIVAATLIVAVDPGDPTLLAPLVEGALLLAGGLAIIVGEWLHNAGGSNPASLPAG